MGNLTSACFSFARPVAAGPGTDKPAPTSKPQPAEDLPSVTPGRVPVFIMMPLDWMADDGTRLRDPSGLLSQLTALKGAGVRGVMADVWWGLCEPEAGKYKFGAVLELCRVLKPLGMNLQATMSFHQCGGNVGDPLYIPLPKWARDIANKEDLLYRYGANHVSNDCLSLSADKCVVFPGGPSGRQRTALDCYRHYMAAFFSQCREHLGETISEMQVGCGPCGELRYPSYMMDKGWNYPGVGLVTADDAGMRRMLKEATGMSELPAGLPQEQNALPDGSPAFKAGAPAEQAFRQGETKRFLEWYSGALLEHGKLLLNEATEALKQEGPVPPAERFGFSVKVSGLHWHVQHPSRATEACAGYNCCTHDHANAYNNMAAMFAEAAQHAKRPIFFNFTCLEMSNTDNNGNPQTLSAPEDLIAQVRQACVRHAVPLSGENALEFDLATGGWAFERMSKQMRGWSPGRDKMHSLTLLRLNERFVKVDCLRELGKFVAST